MSELVLRPPLSDLWQGRDAFAEVGKLQGQVVRDKEGRRTFRCEIGGAVYYVKHHRGVGWREIIKNLVQLRLPIVDASNEWLAINRLTALGVDTLDAVAFGRKGRNPATRESFLITRELTDTVPLEDIAARWPDTPPSPRLRRAMTQRVAEISRKLHRNGINHRDLYLCHFLLDLSGGEPESLPLDQLRFYVVDLHRAQIRKRVPSRWLVKDLASLYFSALDTGLTKRDVMRFLRHYFDLDVRTVLDRERTLLRRVSARTLRLYQRDFGRAPDLPF